MPRPHRFREAAHLARGTNPASRGSRLRGVRSPHRNSSSVRGPLVTYSASCPPLGAKGRKSRHRETFIEQVKDIITVGEFYDLAVGGQIIFT